ncbi:MAG: redoxin domain-containing protein [Clostridiales bacterium]|nr:redoxin domain-containing protein [Clostridiales bacterium]
MKKLKKLLLLTLACLTVFTVGAFTACGDDDGNNGNNTNQGGETPEPIDYVYKIRTQSEGGFGLKDINVTLYDGDNKLITVSTNSEGNAFFTSKDIASTGTYRISLSNIPAGWRVKNDSVIYQTSTISGSNVNIDFSASLITTESVPETKMYRLGDVMYDFTMKDCNGVTHTLSKILEEKQMVMLNFWATYCGPCAAEFPVMTKAYDLYQDKVEILAVSSYQPDTQSVVSEYKQGKLDSMKTPLSFPMAGVPDSTVITSHFDTSAVPVTVVVDRYGVVSYLHAGNMLALSDFTSLFDKFVGDDYIQTVISSDEINGGNGGNGGVVEMTKPTVQDPDIESVKSAFAGANDAFEFSWETEDEYAWPWLITEKDGSKYLSASNKEIDNSYAILNIDFTADADSVLAFDYSVATEPDADYLYVIIDGTIIHKYSNLIDWTTCYAYVFDNTTAGKHRLTLIYMKDASTSGDDNVFVSNLRFEPKSVLGNDELDLNVLHHASTDWNNPADYKDGNAKTTKFKNYVNVKLGPDGYYHVVADANATVNVETDPLLFADIMNSTRWNKYDLWQLAYNGLLVYNGFDLEEIVEQYAWTANESKNGLIPVSQDLKELLDIVASLDTVIGQAFDENDKKDNPNRENYFNADCHVDYHENEWLEFCLYYKHYGNTPQMADPTRGISYESAIEIFEGKNTIDCFKPIVPIGLKHKFTPTKSGVYHFYSTVDPSKFDTAESNNPQMWLVDSDKKTFLVYNEDFLIHHTGNPENFDVKYYLEAGKTYYCLFAFFLNATGKFDMEINYLGTYYESFTNCAIGPYSMNMVTSETYVPNAQNILYDKETDTYRVANKEGEFLGDIYEGLDDAVYLDLVNPTYLFPSNTLDSFIQTYENYDEDKRLFYLPDENGNAKDYSEIMFDYAFEADLINGTLKGKVKVNAEIMHIMLELTKKYDGFGGVKNSWQMMCYYYQPLGY